MPRDLALGDAGGCGVSRCRGAGHVAHVTGRSYLPRDGDVATLLAGLRCAANALANQALRIAAVRESVCVIAATGARFFA
jgi:hypothetical protein